MPKKVYARLHYGKWNGIEVEDDVTAHMEYENGATGVFITSTGDAHGINCLEIQIDRAKFVLENGSLILDKYEMTKQFNNYTYKKYVVDKNMTGTFGLFV